MERQKILKTQYSKLKTDAGQGVVGSLEFRVERGSPQNSKLITQNLLTSSDQIAMLGQNEFQKEKKII